MAPFLHIAGFDSVTKQAVVAQRVVRLMGTRLRLFVTRIAGTGNTVVAVDGRSDDTS